MDMNDKKIDELYSKIQALIDETGCSKTEVFCMCASYIADALRAEEHPDVKVDVFCELMKKRVALKDPKDG